LARFRSDLHSRLEYGFSAVRHAHASLRTSRNCCRSRSSSSRHWRGGLLRGSKHRSPSPLRDCISLAVSQQPGWLAAETWVA